MIRMFRVVCEEDQTVRMRGNFLCVVDKAAGTSIICFFNGKGQRVKLDYDVQAAVLELCSEMDAQRNIAVTRGDETASLRSAVKERDGKILQLKEDRQSQLGTGNMTLAGFCAWADRVKQLFVIGGKGDLGGINKG